MSICLTGTLLTSLPGQNWENKLLLRFAIGGLGGDGSGELASEQLELEEREGTMSGGDGRDCTDAGLERMGEAGGVA